MYKKIRFILIIMGFSMFFISCEKDDTIVEKQNENFLDLKTVSSKDVAKAYKSSQLTKNTQNWITPYFEYNDSISVNNSNAYITVTPAITSIPNTYSRMFSINIDGEIKTVVYNMFPNDQSTPSGFYGSLIITELNGDILSAFEVENNLYTTYYHVKGSGVDKSILELVNKNGGGPDDEADDCVDENNEELWVLCGDEVIVEGDPPEDSGTVIIIFVPVLIEGDDGGGGGIPPPTPGEPSAPATDTNQDNCPPEQVKDDNGNCVEPEEPCPSLKVRNNDDICECPDGFAEDKDGNCKEKPCDKDPVKNPEVAGQNLSGIEGGQFGCTRNGFGCPGDSNKRQHGGLDIKNSEGSPVFAMYDGNATAWPTEFDRAGWVVVLMANIDGVSTKIQYFHLQQSDRANGPVKAGDIIGYQGKSGNLDGAIENGDTESHVHIKISNNQGLQDPEDYIGNLSTEDGSTTISNPDCN